MRKNNHDDLEPPEKTMPAQTQSNHRFNRVALYARVSTDDQTCEMQIDELRRYCSARSWTVAKEYVDTGFSGAKKSRPAFDTLLADARKRRFDVILCWKLDRFGRSVAHLVNVIEELTALGVRFLAVTQNLDTDKANPMSQLLFHLLAAFAEFERTLIQERIAAGIARSRANGHKRFVAPDKAERVRALRAEGKSIRTIAAELHLSHGTAQRLAAARLS
jgi:DNA invertase Pin-like site-specific DNA recombinase